MSQRPLAERMRPNSLDTYIGQTHLVGKNAPLRRFIEQGYIPSLILWGPPGVGKTTLAQIIAKSLDTPFYTLSAVTSGVKEVREVLEKAKQETTANLFNQDRSRPILFIDEIHRFNKSQQDSLLGAVEQGTITLIGATTENPSFEVIRPLLSRSEVYILKSLTEDELLSLTHQAIEQDEILNQYKIEIIETEALFRFSAGDARKLLNLLELVIQSQIKSDKLIRITNQLLVTLTQHSPMAFDKGGEMHFDIASAFIKSIRGSDPQAAIYWLARLIEGGEDPKFIARRVVISAAEDIGLANPNALLMANAAFDAVERIGWPEGRIPLAEAVIYLAKSPKSNSAYNAINSALQFVRESGNLPVPLHLRNAPTQLMKEVGYGADYKYPHDYPQHWVEQQYLPDKCLGKVFYTPDDTERKTK